MQESEANLNKYLNPKRYWQFFINKAISISSPVIKIWEKKQYKKYAAIPIKHQPIFIIGAPRTGSTILYQTLTNQLDVLYIDNLACRFNKNLFFGFCLSNLFFKQKAHNCFSSNHGATKGLHSPSECGGFWYRWLPSDRHFIDHDDVTDKMVKEIREEITAITNKYDKPVVFKNLNAGQRLRLIKKVFPDARFIFSKREPLYTAQSILKAKRKLKLSDNKFWGIMPKNVDELSTRAWPEQIVGQIYYIEKQIEQDLALFDNGDSYTVSYSNLNNDTVDNLKEYFALQPRCNYKESDINLNENISITLEEQNLIETEINNLDWSNFK